MVSLNFSPYLHVLPNVIYSFIIGLSVTPFLRRFGLKHGFSTKPKEETDPNERGFVTKHHHVTMPRLGEFAMLIPLGLLMWRDLDLNTQLFGIVVAISMVGILGAMDSKYNLSEFVKLYILLFSSLMLVFTGTVINIHDFIGHPQWDLYINNPLTHETLYILSSFATIAWIYIVSTALSYVGGIDGLSEGTSAIAILILTLIGIRNGDIITITIGTLCIGGLLGLLPYNFHPAVIYSEHLIYGFIIAILAIISKGKVSTAILILAIPLIDFIWVSARRTRRFLKEKPKGVQLRLWLHYLGTGDRTHFHHKLMDLGMNPVQISLTQYIMYSLVGLLAIAVSGLYLTFAILSSVVLIVLILYYINKKLSHEP